MLGVQAVVPMHYGTFPILAGTPEELSDRLGGSGIEVARLEIGVPAT
jgi:L-ascorbate metabolism protein UlaG (beta-lactamase superfamily)